MVKEFYDYWLYYYCFQVKKITYNTFQTYRNCIFNHLVPALGPDRKLKDVTSSSIEKAFREIPSENVKRATVALVKRTFKLACSSHYLSSNLSISALRNLRGEIHEEEPRSVVPCTAPEIRSLLHTCREHFQWMYIVLLLAVTMGLRISETSV